MKTLLKYEPKPSDMDFSEERTLPAESNNVDIVKRGLSLLETAWKKGLEEGLERNLLSRLRANFCISFSNLTQVSWYWTRTEERWSFSNRVFL